MENEIQKASQELQNFDVMEDTLIYLLQDKKEKDKRMEDTDNRLEMLEKTQPVNPSVTSVLEQKRKKRVIECLGGKEAEAYRQISRKVFAEAGHDFKTMFHIPRYDMLQRKDEQLAMNYWERWEPSTNTRMEIQQLNNQVQLQLAGSDD